MGNETFFIIILVLLVVHFVLALLVWVYSAKAGNLRWEYIMPIIMVPIFGPGLAITVELLHKYGKPGRKEVELEPLKLDNDIYWRSFKKTDEDSDVIPLEEAILLNDRYTRRKAVLDTFRDDSAKYLDVLMLARDNEDVDTTHYATIQISNALRAFESKVQTYAEEHRELAKKYSENPKDQELFRQYCKVLDEYLDVLESYLESNLAEERVLHRQRKIFLALLNERLDLLGPDKHTLIRKLRVCNDLKESCEEAQSVVDELKQRWPTDEQTWIEALRVCVEWRDEPRFHETVEQIKSATNIAWTKHGRAQVRPWVQV